MVSATTGTGDTGSGGDVTGPGGAGSGVDGAGGSGSSIDTAPDVTPIVDAQDGSDRACPMATYTFETGTPIAHLGSMQAAATSVTNSTANHYCGQHALEITTAFSGTSGMTTIAGVQIDLTTAGQQNLSGKTITIHVSANPEPMPATYLALTLITGTTGNTTLMPFIRPLTSEWQAQSYKIATGTATMTVTSLAIQIFDIANYKGKIYIDDLDIR